jgi:hypothetical protein
VLITAAPDLSFGVIDRLQALLAGPATAFFIAAGLYMAVRVLAESIERIGDEVEPTKEGQTPARRVTFGSTLKRIAAIALITLLAVVVVNNGLDVFRELVRFAYSLTDAPQGTPAP